MVHNFELNYNGTRNTWNLKYLGTDEQPEDKLIDLDFKSPEHAQKWADGYARQIEKESSKPQRFTITV